MPKDFTSFASDQEKEAFGNFLIHAIASPLGLPDDPNAIDRAVYKWTSCGAWVRFDDLGVVVGTIVECSDAEYSERIELDGIEVDDTGEAELNRRFWDAIQRCEDFASEEWAEADSMNESDDE